MIPIGSEAPETARVEWHVLRVRIDAASRAAEAALSASSGRYASKAGALEAELAFMRKQADQVMPAPPSSPPPDPLPAERTRGEPPRPSSPRRVGGIALAAAGLAAILVLVIALLVLTTDTVDDAAAPVAALLH